MSDIELLKYGKYLCELISCVINSTAPKKPFDGMDWMRLYKLAKLHNVIPLIYPALNDFDIPDAVTNKFVRSQNLAVAREARCDIESSIVYKAFVDNGLSFVKVKGAVLKNIYPKPYMRTYIDIDLCMTPEGRAKAKDVMLELGYEMESSVDYHDEYSKDSFFIFEIHSPLVSPVSMPKFVALFEDVFSISKNEKENEYVLKDEYNYLYILFHIYKHFRFNGCGLRGFVDLWLLERSCSDMDWDFVEKTIRDLGLYEYYSHVRKLIAVFFKGEILSKRYDEIAEYIFKNGEHGRTALKKAAQVSSDRSVYVSGTDKLRYTMSKCFPKAEDMKHLYPVLDKAPVLLPICWIRRSFNVLLHKHDALKKHKEDIESFDSEEVREAKRVHELLGID